MSGRTKSRHLWEKNQLGAIDLNRSGRLVDRPTTRPKSHFAVAAAAVTVTQRHDVTV